MVCGSTRWETAAQRAAGAGGGTGEPCGAVGGNGESTESGRAAQGDEDGAETAAAAGEHAAAARLVSGMHVLSRIAHGSRYARLVLERSTPEA
jgi:hypothetical protein